MQPVALAHLPHGSVYAFKKYMSPNDWEPADDY